jgi:hypothetical protein
LDPAIVEKIQQRLDDLRIVERVAVPLAEAAGPLPWPHPFSSKTSNTQQSQKPSRIGD